MHKQKPARRDIAPYDVQWVLASLAGLLLLAAYLPKKSSAVFFNRIKARLNRRQPS